MIADQPTVTLNSKSDCPYCDTARTFLAAHTIPYVEVKHDDTAERQALYDRLGLVGKARTMPQVVLSADGEDYLVGGSQDLRMCGIQSLFGGVAVSGQAAVSVKVEPTADMVVAEEGHSCCE